MSTEDESAEKSAADSAAAIAPREVDRLRNRLLDLTTRNPLLHYRHPKKSSLRVVDELPDFLFERLVSGKPMIFTAVPRPEDPQLDVDAAAELAGIETGYEVPSDAASRAEKHVDDFIQTLLFPEDLESRLMYLRRLARTAEEESGINILHLVLGFLEWYESDSSDMTRLAPLVLVPVRLGPLEHVRGMPGRTAALEYTDEDLSTNVSLAEHLKHDFSIALPPLKPDEAASDFSTEQYFEAVATAIEGQKRWRVRRCVSVGLFQFANIYLWRDLAPKNNVFDHPLVKRLFVGDAEREPVVEESAIERLDETTTNTPLVLDADSSQHAAVESVVAGSNLVVQGPPGTGKSQTIANLIGVALATGKTVLFVSEKLAALEVVRRKLDSVGLGDFCLELHSHKTSRRAVLDDVARRIAMGFRSPHELSETIRTLEAQKRELMRFTSVAEQPAGCTRKTLAQGMFAASRWRLELDSFFDGRLLPRSLEMASIPDVEQRDEDWLAQSAELVTQLGSSRAAVDRESSGGMHHPWAGVANSQLNETDIPRLRRHAEHISTTCQGLNAAMERVSSVAGTAIDDTMGTARLISDAAGHLRMPSSNDELRWLPLLYGENARMQVRQISGEVADLHGLAPSVLQPLGGRSGLEQRLPRLVELIRSASGWEQYSPEQIAASGERAAGSAAAMREYGELLVQFARGIGLGTTVDEDSLAVLSTAATLALEAPTIPDELYGVDLGSAEGERQLREARQVAAHIYAELDWVHASFAKGIDVECAQDAAHALAEAKWYSWMSTSYRRARRYFRSLWRGPPLPGPRHEAKALRRYAEAETARAALDADTTLAALLPGRFIGLDTPFDAAVALSEWQQRVRGEPALDKELANRLVRVTGDILRDMKKGARGVLQATHRIAQATAGLSREQTSSPAAADAALTNHADWLRSLSAELTALGAPTSMPLRELAGAVGSAREWLDSEARLQTGLGRVLDSAAAELVRDPERLRTALSFADALAKWPGPGPVAAFLAARASTEAFTEVRDACEAVAHCASTASGALGDFASDGQVQVSVWIGTPLAETAVANLAATAARAFADESALRSWLGYIRIRAELERRGLQFVLDGVDNGDLPLEVLPTAVSWCYWKTLVGGSPATPQLTAVFSGTHVDSLRAKFVELDKTLASLRREQIAFAASQRPIPPGRASGRVRELTGLALIQHEMGKQRRHIPIRDLLRRAAEALQALKPCFMMGPLAVAQYIEHGTVQFDLLIFDEASQVRPEHALSAVARAKQVVVVGDSKQLPPTRFFERIQTDDDDDDEVGRLEEHESLLSAATNVLPDRMLKWHYRSRHESLIRFSNHEFYDDDLIVFPSPDAENPLLGVHFVRTQGVFDDRRNIEEARCIVDAVVEHMGVLPDRSLGVVAMNIAQADYLDDLMQRRRTDDPTVREYMAAWEDRGEPFFVKNLENVQGDERDDIFISFTYGPKTPGGAVPQRFALINQAGGWRRLNVLYTRARQRVIAFSSMEAGDVRVAAGRRGLEALRGYLDFAKTGELPTAEITGREPDSDFEIAVIRALQNHGYTCIPQVGVAGYFIDIGVQDLEDRGRFVLGVECDGATYHSSKVARDRDRLRQQVLEGYGWQIHRIWSTDWYQDPRGQIEKLLARLRSLADASKRRSREARDEPEVEKAVSDAGEPSGEQEGSARDDARAPPLQPEIATETIEVGASGLTGKQAFVDADGRTCSTEQAAIGYLQRQGFSVLRGEVDFWQAMFTLAFWEEIFDGMGPPCHGRDIPHGLFAGPKFYEARRDAIDRKADLLEWCQLPDFIRNQLTRYGENYTRILYGTPDRQSTYREFLESREVAEFLAAIPPATFAKVVHRIAKNPSANRAGLPDYMIWKDGEVEFVEVKREHEHVRSAQVIWLTWMAEQGIPTKILRVRGVQ